MNALYLAIALILLLPSTSSAKTACSPVPNQAHESERWGYRIVDERKCWFALTRGERRGEHRDLGELYWPAPLPISDRLPWELEGRWSGWNHQE